MIVCLLITVAELKTQFGKAAKIPIVVDRGSVMIAAYGLTGILITEIYSRRYRLIERVVRIDVLVFMVIVSVDVKRNAVAEDGAFD